MRITYRRRLEPEIEVPTTPQPETFGGVDVGWTANDSRLTFVTFTVCGVALDDDLSDTVITYNDGAMAKVFAAARFIGDRIRIQTGFDVILPFSLVGNSPDEITGETTQEEVYLKQHPQRNQRSIMATAAITRPFDPNVYTDFERLAVPAGHFARAQRTSDPLDKFEDYFKALEYFASRRQGDDPSGATFDKQLSKVTEIVDRKYDKTRIGIYRDLRRRVVHTRTTHVLGHIGPTDIEGIREVQALLNEMEQLVWALLKNPPAFPR